MKELNGAPLVMTAMLAFSACSEEPAEAAPDGNEASLGAKAQKVRIVLVHGALRTPRVGRR